MMDRANTCVWYQALLCPSLSASEYPSGSVYRCKRELVASELKLYVDMDIPVALGRNQ